MKSSWHVSVKWEVGYKPSTYFVLLASLRDGRDWPVSVEKSAINYKLRLMALDSPELKLGESFPLREGSRTVGRVVVTSGYVNGVAK